jgi:histone-lysine N-methyltransferase SETMAR
MTFPFPVDVKYVRAFVAFCAALGEPAGLILEKLDALFGADAQGKSFVYTWSKLCNDPNGGFEDAPRTGRPSIGPSLVDPILAILQDEPFASVRTLAYALEESRETVRRTLLDVMHFRKFKCRWIPHKLTDALREKRVAVAGELLEFLEDGEILKNVITGDQSWFYFYNPADGQWAESLDDVSINIKESIGSRKVMVTFLWSKHGVHLIDFLPQSETFTSAYFVTVLDQLQDKIAQRRPVNKLNGMYLHLDNASPHRAGNTKTHVRNLGLTMLPHPPYSPDIAPTDFFLLGHIKQQLEGKHFTNEEELMKAIVEVVRQIPKETFENVMEKWIDRLHYVIDNDGDYCDQ